MSDTWFVSAGLGLRWARELPPPTAWPGGRCWPRRVTHSSQGCQGHSELTSAGAWDLPTGRHPKERHSECIPRGKRAPSEARRGPCGRASRSMANQQYPCNPKASLARLCPLPPREIAHLDTNETLRKRHLMLSSISNHGEGHEEVPSLWPAAP